MSKRKLNKNSTILEIYDSITGLTTNGSEVWCTLSREQVEVFRELLRREVEK